MSVRQNLRLFFVIFVALLAAAPVRATNAEPQSIPGPVAGTRMPIAYIREMARTAYFWAWPMVNVHNRMLTYDKLPGPGLSGGVLPVAPPNHLSMLHDYIEPSERAVACPNQDVAYGQMVLALDREPVVLQVPDFGDRFWVYQIVDQRTDSFAEIGKMYGTKPGFYLLVGTDWKGEAPQGIAAVFRSPTKLGMVIPRVFMNDTAEDRAAIQPTINQIDAYPLSQFDGKVKLTEWTKAAHFPGATGSSEVKWVKPELFASQLGAVLDEVPPFPGEVAYYEQLRVLLAASDKDPKIKIAITEGAKSSEKDLVEPLFQFRNYGLACRETGRPRATAQNLGPTTSRAPPSPSRTSSLTSRMRRNTFIRISTRMADV
jgi:hypothetical protein